jgi:hypothetical protein
MSWAKFRTPSGTTYHPRHSWSLEGKKGTGPNGLWSTTNSWCVSHSFFLDVFPWTLVYYGIDSETGPWPKGLVFLEALRECLRGSLRAAYTRVLLTRGPYCHKYDWSIDGICIYLNVYIYMQLHYIPELLLITSWDMLINNRRKHVFVALLEGWWRISYIMGTY